MLRSFFYPVIYFITPYNASLETRTLKYRTLEMQATVCFGIAISVFSFVAGKYNSNY